MRNYFFSVLIFFFSHFYVSAQTCHQIFKNSFFSSEVYESGECCHNIYRLIKKFQNENPTFQLSKAKIIYIFPQGMSRTIDLRTSETRLSTTNPSFSWKYHTVLEYKGKIFDFDFNNHPKIVSTHEYFERLFIRYHAPRIRVFSSEFFMETYKQTDKNNPLDFVYSKYNEKFPIQDLNSYLGWHDD